MSLLGELRRRNVIRMAGLYLIGAWLVVQVAETLLPIFGTPDWVLKTLVLLLALGFVPAMMFAWVFELTPDGLKRDRDVPPEQSIAPRTARRMDRLIVIGLVAVAALVAVDRFWPRDVTRAEAAAAPNDAEAAAAANDPVPTPEPRSASDVAAGDSAPGSSSPSIAVLPFVNMSADKDNEYFSDGISEELLNVLVRVEGLGVASRTSSFAYKGRDLGAAALAKALKVDPILEGSVRKSGNRVRITAQLIDAVDDRHLWSETYDRELTDIFAIQGEIANAIVTALRGTLGAAGPAATVTVAADTDNLRAYELYLKARELFIARTELPESLRLFEQVVEMDPKFARGWEGLAAICSVVESWGMRDRDYTAMAKVAAERALALDPALSMPWAALGTLEQSEIPVDWEKSLALADRSIAADAKNATAFLWRSIAWTNLGYFSRAIADQDSCLALDPAYQNCTRWKALTLLFAGQTTEALALFEKGGAKGFIASRAASFVPPLLERGERVGALLLLKEIGAAPELSVILLAAMAQPERPPADAQAIVDRFLPAGEEESTRAISRAKTYLWLGDYERAANSPDNTSDELLAWEPYPPTFRNSPGFKRTLERLGVVTYWRKHGYPPQCRPLGEADFECDKGSR